MCTLDNYHALVERCQGEEAYSRIETDEGSHPAPEAQDSQYRKAALNHSAVSSQSRRNVGIQSSTN